MSVKWFKPHLGQKVWFRMYLGGSGEYEGTIKFLERDPLSGNSNNSWRYRIWVERNGRIYDVDRALLRKIEEPAEIDLQLPYKEETDEHFANCTS